MEGWRRQTRPRSRRWGAAKTAALRLTWIVIAATVLSRAIGSGFAAYKRKLTRPQADPEGNSGETQSGSWRGRHFFGRRGRHVQKALIAPQVLPQAVAYAQLASQQNTRMAVALTAGAVAAIVQATLFAVTEPIVNRVNVRRMRVVEACAEVKASMMLRHFRTTLPTSVIKTPLYEVTLAVVSASSVPMHLQGPLLGILTTLVLLPLTNFRARMSLQEDFRLSDAYIAFAPTVFRDMVGGAARTHALAFGLQALELRAQSPQLMAFSMVVGCLLSAPLNELRGFLLQQPPRKSMSEFFQLGNCIRSTLVGTINFAVAVAAGYWAAPHLQAIAQYLFG
mmetsp:Transcript_23626/g.55051  ORF Transcript_23626/g.55051 Transcript_23626/m.55051 type:complete len:337 (-) Transcript_23626:224-1234(-)